MLVVKTTSPEISPSPAKVQPTYEVPSSSTTKALLRRLCLSSYSKLCSYPIVHQLTADHRTHDAPLEPPPEVRAVGGPADQSIRLDRPLFGEVHERQIPRCTRRDAIRTVPSDPTPRSTRHRLDQPRERKLSALHKLRVERGAYVGYVDLSARLRSQDEPRCRRHVLGAARRSRPPRQRRRNPIM